MDLGENFDGSKPKRDIHRGYKSVVKIKTLMNSKILLTATQIPV